MLNDIRYNANLDEYKTKLSMLFRRWMNQALHDCIKYRDTNNVPSPVVASCHLICKWIENITTCNDPINIAYRLDSLNDIARRMLNQARTSYGRAGFFDTTTNLPITPSKYGFSLIEELYQDWIPQVIDDWINQLESIIEHDDIRKFSLLKGIYSNIKITMKDIAECVHCSPCDETFLDMKINSLVVLGLQFCHRIRWISYGTDYSKDRYDENPKLKLVDNFFNYLEIWLEVICFPRNDVCDKFMDWRCTALYTNKAEIFNIAAYGDYLHNTFKLADLNVKDIDIKIAPNIIMLHKNDQANIHNLSNVSSANLREIKESGLLEKPTFNVNQKTLIKLMGSDKGISLNQIKMLDKNNNRIYTRVLMEKSGNSYILIFDKDNASSICGLMLESTSDSNNYIKMVLANDDYKYDFDNIIIRTANNEDIFEKE